MKHKKKIAVALGSGGAKGLAHIGALQVFEEYGINIKIITGTSIGAIIGGLYSEGVNPYKLEEYAQKLKLNQIVGLTIPSRHGFLSSEKAEKTIREILKKSGQGEDFSTCIKKFGVATTDLLSGKPYYIYNGNMVEAIKASFSIPIVFKPIVWDNKLLIDGGPLTRVPVKLARKLGADIVIAIDCIGETCTIDSKYLSNIGDTYTRFLTMSDYAISKPEIESADYIISINQDNLSAISLKNLDEFIQNGRKYAESFIKSHPEILEI